MQFQVDVANNLSLALFFLTVQPKSYQIISSPRNFLAAISSALLEPLVPRSLLEALLVDQPALFSFVIGVITGILTLSILEFGMLSCQTSIISGDGTAKARLKGIRLVN